MKLGGLAWVCPHPEAVPFPQRPAVWQGWGHPSNTPRKLRFGEQALPYGEDKGRLVLEISPALVEKLQADLLCKRNI